MSRRAPAILAAAFVLFLLSSCAGPPRYTTTSPPDPAPNRPSAPRPAERPGPRLEALGGAVIVRVAVAWDEDDARITCPGGMRFHSGDTATPRRIAPGKTLTASAGRGEEFRLRGGGIDHRGRSAELAWLEPEREEQFLQVAGQPYRGRLQFAARAGSLFVVNHVPLEEYLRGVVPREIGPRPAAEQAAVAAQAIAARTYAVRKLEQYQSLPFDAFSSVQDQVYRGVSEENAVADAAIRETEGLILAGRGEGPLATFYSSTCGGQRSDIEAVWPWRDSHPTLRGGPCGSPGEAWCRESRHFRWIETWTGSELEKLVRRHLPTVLSLPPGSVRGSLRDVKVLRRGPSGRAEIVEYVTSEGRWQVPGDRNRWILRREGGGILRSVQIDLSLEKQGGRVRSLRVTGQGNGHGIGMCQMGAIGQAQAGRSYREILETYYPGAEIRPLRGSDLPSGRARAL